MSGRSPFDDVSLLVIDGNNRLHRTAGGPGSSAARVLIPRLRAALPSGVGVALVLDGMADPGAPIREHIGSVTIAHAGRRSADDAIVEAIQQRAYEERPRTIVVTDDRALAERVKRLGALHRRVAWLQDVLELAHRGPRGTSAGGAAASSPIGRPGVRPPRPPTPRGSELEPAGEADDAERKPWTPGRGATRKRGNPMRRRSRGAR
ncbi:MAG: hypothetical protein ABWY52_04335 [Candidatus Limnocylindrales bacterium]